MSQNDSLLGTPDWETRPFKFSQWVRLTDLSTGSTNRWDSYAPPPCSVEITTAICMRHDSILSSRWGQWRRGCHRGCPLDRILGCRGPRTTQCSAFWAACNVTISSCRGTAAPSYLLKQHQNSSCVRCLCLFQPQPPTHPRLIFLVGHLGSIEGKPVFSRHLLYTLSLQER